MHNLTKKLRKRWAKLRKGMCQFKFSPKEIEYLSADNVTFFFEFFFCLHFIFNSTYG
jgi:hypothetical protein